MYNIAVRIEPYFCSDIHSVAESAVQLSNQLRFPVVFTLNNITMYTYPCSSVRAMDQVLDLVTKYEDQIKAKTVEGRFESAAARADRRA